MDRPSDAVNGTAGFSLANGGLPALPRAPKDASGHGKGFWKTRGSRRYEIGLCALSGSKAGWTLWEPSYLYIHQERERAILRLLGRHGFHPLKEAKVLEIGCGSGSILGGVRPLRRSAFNCIRR